MESTYRGVSKGAGRPKSAEPELRMIKGRMMDNLPKGNAAVQVYKAIPNLKLKRPRKRAVSGHCPFPDHDDRNASFWIDMDTGRCHCCCRPGKSFLPPDILMAQGTPEMEAWRWYAREAGIDLTPRQRQPQPSPSLFVKWPAGEAEARLAAGLVATQAHIDRLETAFAESRAFSRDTILSYIPVTADGSMALFPLRDERGIAQVYGRAVRRGVGPKNYCFLNERDAGYFPRMPSPEDRGTVWICESFEDTLHLIQAGELAFTRGGYGKRLYKPELFAGRTVILCGDKDRSGLRGTSQKWRDLEAAGAREVLALYWPAGTRKGYDVGDWFRDGGTVEALRELARPDVREIHIEDLRQAWDCLPGKLVPPEIKVLRNVLERMQGTSEYANPNTRQLMDILGCASEALTKRIRFLEGLFGGALVTVERKERCKHKYRVVPLAQLPYNVKRAILDAAVTRESSWNRRKKPASKIEADAPAVHPEVPDRTGAEVSAQVVEICFDFRSP